MLLAILQGYQLLMFNLESMVTCNMINPGKKKLFTQKNNFSFYKVEGKSPLTVKPENGLIEVKG